MVQKNNHHISCTGTWAIFRGGKCHKNWHSMAENTSDKDFKINHDNGIGYITDVDIKYVKHLHKFYNDLPFLHDRVNIDKCNKFLYIFAYKKHMLCT